MLKIGLTGGIGSGKTVVAHMLQERGIPIINADRVAKEMMQNDPAIRNELVQAFGSEIYTPDGNLNRSKMAALIFSDPDARERVNAIVHPRVLQFQENEMQRLEKQGTPIAGVEAALIYEVGSEYQFDVMVVVAAAQTTVVERLSKRDAMTKSEIQNRMAAQMPIEEKMARADYVIENDSTMNELKHQVDLFIEWLKMKREILGC